MRLSCLVRGFLSCNLTDEYCMKNYAIYMLLTVGLLSLWSLGARHTVMPTVYAQGNNDTPVVVVESVPNSSLADSLIERAYTSWPWYVTRASGLVAGLLMILLMISGMGFITGTTFRFLEPITAWASHRALGIALGVAILVHVVSLYFDTFVEFDIAALLVPFASNYQPVTLFGVSFGSLYVALGVLALYLCVIIVITSLVWIRTKPKSWKLLHFLSYMAMAFVFVHALYLGTDLTDGALRWAWIGAGVLIGYNVIGRLWRAYTV
jgi:methionine sulfoxide reductase heme-binding subunit